VSPLRDRHNCHAPFRAPSSRRLCSCQNPAAWTRRGHTQTASLDSETGVWSSRRRKCEAHKDQRQSAHEHTFIHAPCRTPSQAQHGHTDTHTYTHAHTYTRAMENWLHRLHQASPPPAAGSAPPAQQPSRPPSSRRHPSCRSGRYGGAPALPADRASGRVVKVEEPKTKPYVKKFGKRGGTVRRHAPTPSLTQVHTQLSGPGRRAQIA
jgi:hypothetical protein